MKRKSLHAGFTLLEVMLAIVILCIGLLGLAAMQVIGMRSSSTSSYLSQATILASDMTERIRANQLGMSHGKYAAYNSDGQDCGTFPTPYCGEYSVGGTTVAGAACTPDAMAAYDLHVVSCGNRLDATHVQNDGVQALPGGRIEISCNGGAACTAPYNHVVTVFWNDIARDADGKTTNIERSLVVPVVP